MENSLDLVLNQERQGGEAKNRNLLVDVVLESEDLRSKIGGILGAPKQLNPSAVKQGFDKDTRDYEVEIFCEYFFDFINSRPKLGVENFGDSEEVELALDEYDAFLKRNPGEINKIKGAAWKKLSIEFNEYFSLEKRSREVSQLRDLLRELEEFEKQLDDDISKNPLLRFFREFGGYSRALFNNLKRNIEGRIKSGEDSRERDLLDRGKKRLGELKNSWENEKNDPKWPEIDEILGKGGVVIKEFTALSSGPGMMSYDDNWGEGRSNGGSPEFESDCRIYSAEGSYQEEEGENISFKEYSDLLDGAAEKKRVYSRSNPYVNVYAILKSPGRD